MKFAAANLVKSALVVLVLAAVAFFFYRAFRDNWASIQQQDFRLNIPFLTASALCITASALLGTYTWHLSINWFARGRTLSFAQSVAAVNASGLTKYVPGKVWSYALQMYWLSGFGLSKPLIAFINIINLYVSILTALIVGLACLLASPEFPRQLTAAALLSVIALDVCSVCFYRPIFRRVVAFLNRKLKREMGYLELPLGRLFRLHLFHGLAAVAIGLSAYLVCFGVGYRLPLSDVPLVCAASLLSEVIGFLAVFVPGGLGVREGVMYFLLGGAANGAIAVVLPIASRGVGMLVDVAMGLLALKLLRKLAQT